MIITVVPYKGTLGWVWTLGFSTQDRPASKKISLFNIQYGLKLTDRKPKTLLTQVGLMGGLGLTCLRCTEPGPGS